MKYEPTTLQELNLVKTNSIGILEIPDTEFESKINNLLILLNTQEGEKVMDKNYGIRFTSHTFEHYKASSNEDLEFQLIEMLKGKASKYFPEFQLNELEAMIDQNEVNNSSLIIRCLWIYRNKWQFQSFTLAKPNDKFGTLFSDVSQYESQGQSPNNIISKKMMVNIINNINTQLSSKEFEKAQQGI